MPAGHDLSSGWVGKGFKSRLSNDGSMAFIESSGKVIHIRQRTDVRVVAPFLGKRDAVGERRNVAMDHQALDDFAQLRDIVRQFLTESVLISAGGGFQL